MPLKPFAVPYVVVPRECRVQFPKPCFKGLKWGRWDCNVRGGAAESSVIRIACDLWVVRPWIELLCSFVGPRMLPTIPGGIGLVLARLAVLLDEAVVARVGSQRRGERHQQRKHSARREAARDYISLWPLPSVCCGGVLLSHNPSVAVPSALPGLASRFGMLLGVSPVL